MVYRQEKIKPYNDKEEKGAQVEQNGLLWNVQKSESLKMGLLNVPRKFYMEDTIHLI